MILVQPQNDVSRAIVRHNATCSMLYDGERVAI